MDALGFEWWVTSDLAANGVDGELAVTGYDTHVGMAAKLRGSRPTSGRLGPVTGRALAWTDRAGSRWGSTEAYIK